MSIRTNDHAGIARAILANGRPFVTGWYDDGDAESGPRGGTIRGIRWGQLEISIADYQAHAHVSSRACGAGPWGPRSGWPIVFGRVEDPEIISAILAAHEARAAAEQAAEA